MKNTLRVLGIAIILLLLAQIVVMFMPYFDFSDMVKPDRKGNIPESEFSLQEYCWMDTEDMGKNFFKELIEDYNVNDHAVSLVLTFVIGCVVVILNAMRYRHGNKKILLPTTDSFYSAGRSCRASAVFMDGHGLVMTAAQLEQKTDRANPAGTHHWACNYFKHFFIAHTYYNITNGTYGSY